MPALPTSRREPLAQALYRAPQCAPLPRSKAGSSGLINPVTLQYISTLPNAWYQEFCEQDTLLRQQLTTPLFSIDDEGYVAIPQEPGMGIAVNPDVVAKYRVTRWN